MKLIFLELKAKFPNKIFFSDKVKSRYVSKPRNFSDFFRNKNSIFFMKNAIVFNNSKRISGWNCINRIHNRFHLKIKKNLLSFYVNFVKLLFFLNTGMAERLLKPFFISKNVEHNESKKFLHIFLNT
jgi:hypothetical protein